MANLEVRNLNCSYSKAGKQILKDVSFTVDHDEFVALIGPSGAGKSTVMRCINRLVEPSDGQIILNGDDVRKASGRKLRLMRQDMGMIFQEFNLIDRISVIENVLTARLGRMGNTRALFKLFSKEDVEKALYLLEKVGLADHVNKRADQLSGGQRQRVGIARALMQNPKLLLADEPTSALDPKISREVMALILDMAREFKVPALCNIHDINLATEFCTRIIGLQDGVKMFEGTPAELDKKAMKDIYAMEVL